MTIQMVIRNTGGNEHQQNPNVSGSKSAPAPQNPPQNVPFNFSNFSSFQNQPPQQFQFQGGGGGGVGNDPGRQIGQILVFIYLGKY